MKSCDTFDGEWEQSHSLIAERKNHVSWQSPAGILLMGGDNYGYPDYRSHKSTELLSTTTNTSTPGFNLTYITENACAIEFEDLVVVTGGLIASSIATVH